MDNNGTNLQHLVADQSNKISGLFPKSWSLQDYPQWLSHVAPPKQEEQELPEGPIEVSCMLLHVVHLPADDKVSRL